jgi:TonB family protein
MTKTSIKKTLTRVTGSLAWLAVATAVSAQTTDSATAIAQLYSSAAYEDALGAIAKAEPTARLEAYRAFCFLALGKDAEARAAARRAVAEDPLFMPADTEASPRVRTFFREVRTAVLPDLVRERYAAAKTQFVAGDRQGARAGFELTLSLLDSMEEPSRRPLEDLQLLAREFLELARAPLPATPATATVPALPASGTTPTAPVKPVPAVAIDQRFPAWRSTRPLEETRRGLVRLQIVANGAVSRAEIVTATDPDYDREVLNAARSWRYRPATIDGRPLPSEVELTFYLRPKTDPF